jgi:hypothetical protein
LCEFLEAELAWEGQDQGREIAMKFSNNYWIQFSEINEQPVTTTNKKETHIAFHSEEPTKDIQKLRNWFEQRNIKVITGQWSETELWIDCPEIFINFAIEVLKT